MSGIVRPLSVLLALLTAVTGANSFITRSKTYALKYDALVAPELVESYLENEGDGEQSLVPYSMVTEVSTNIATDIVQLYSTTNEPKKSDRSDRVLEMDRRCAQTIMGFGRCSIDYYRPGEVEIQISVTFGAEPEQDSAMVVSVDVSMACNTTSMARDILVRSIPHLNTQLKCFHGMVWSIFERQTPTVMKRHWQASVNLAHHQQQSDANKASLEALILERDDLNNRMRIASAHLHESGKRALEVWHYTSPESRFDVRSLFVNGYLQSTTCSSGTAHAEALVHPGLMSSPEPPKKIGIISLEPTAVLREVLRYKEVESVILLGVDSDALEMTKTHISILNDCGFLSSEVTECTSQPQVEVVFEDLTQWLSSQVTYQQEDPDSYPYFDAILVDVPPGDVGWLDLSLQRNIKHLLDDNSIEIIASGSTPVLSDAYVRAYSPNARDKLMRQTHRSVDVGGLGFYHQYVYDEPLASPQSSSFIALFPGDSDTIDNFVRTNIPMIEVEMIHKLEPVGGTPTLVYDGSTHAGYQRTSRAWQNWFCSTFPGKKLASCATFLESWHDPEKHHFKTEVRKDPVKGRSLHALEDIPAGHFILSDDAAMSMRLDAQQWHALRSFVETFPDAEMYKGLRDFFVAYGYESEIMGQSGWTVSIANNNTFTNHACTLEERNIHYIEEVDKDEDGKENGFDPVVVRFAQILNTLARSTRVIAAGEEIQCDYAAFRSYGEDFHNELLELMCKKGSGMVAPDDGQILMHYNDKDEL